MGKRRCKSNASKAVDRATKRAKISCADDEYEVEQVCGEKDGKLLVKWVGYAKKTWEPIDEIPKPYYRRFQSLAFSSEKKLAQSKTSSSGKKQAQSKTEKEPRSVQVKATSASNVDTMTSHVMAKKQLVTRALKRTTKNDKFEPRPARKARDLSGPTKNGSTNNDKPAEANQLQEQPVLQLEPKPSRHSNTVRTAVTARNLSFLFDDDEAKESPSDVETQKDPSDEDSEFEDHPDESECEVEEVVRVSYNVVPDLVVSQDGSRICFICNKPEEGGRYCATCKKPVHHMCSIELIEDLGIEEILDHCYCSNSCYEAVINQSSTTAKGKGKAKKAVVVKQPTKAKTTVAKGKKKAQASTSNPDDAESVVGKSVAFSPSVEPWLNPKLYTETTLFLVGIITRRRKNGNGQLIADQYEVRWTMSNFQAKQHVHYISLAKAKEGIVNHDLVVNKSMGMRSWDMLCKSYDDVGNESNSKELWDEFEEVQDTYMRYESKHPLPIDLKEVEQIKSMDFRPDAYVAAPDDLFTHSDGSTVSRLKDESKHLFEHSASSSFLAFLPLSFWRKVVETTNAYAAKEKQPLVTLEELMKFLGILFYISMVDKGEYSNYWGDQVENEMFGEVSVGLDRVMALKRFKFLRRSISFRAGVTPQELEVDSAARIRPLINMLKFRSPTHVELGRNVAVDETSIASRSKFGRHLIVYNATKPTGKYHFKIYMCCCSTTWLAVHFKLHCSSSLEERLQGVMDRNDIAAHRLATDHSSDVRKHVLEVTLPIHHTKRIVNTDNFYTSCQLLGALKLEGLYGRGTIRENSKFGPKAFMLSKRDKVPRGTIRQGVDLQHKMIGASWADGAMVNIVSNADDASVTTVIRQVGRNKVSYKAPTCIKEYNKAMQGVDRIDQLRSRFSIADGHSFVKWHIKLAMAFIDIARCNAYICRKLSTSVLDGRDPHRQFMMELSSELIKGDWKNVPDDTGILFSEPIVNKAPSLVAASPRIASPSRSNSECVMTSSSQVFPKGSRERRKCVVCRFEFRYPSEQTVVCGTHHVSLCTSVRPSLQQHRFLCPDTEMTCWTKFHTFYLPAGLFNASGNIRRSCQLFKEKKHFEDRSCAPSLPTIMESYVHSQDEPLTSRTLEMSGIQAASGAVSEANCADTSLAPATYRLRESIESQASMASRRPDSFIAYSGRESFDSATSSMDFGSGLVAQAIKGDSESTAGLVTLAITSDSVSSLIETKVELATSAMDPAVMIDSDPKVEIEDKSEADADVEIEEKSEADADVVIFSF